MKKLFPYILIVFIVVQMLMPFTVGVGVKNNLEVKSNKAEAVGYDWYFLVTKSGIETPEEKRSLLSENNNDDITTKTACENARLASLRTDTTNGTKTGNMCLQVPPSTTVTTTGTTLDSNGAAVIPPPKDTSDLPVCNLNPWSRTGSFSGCFAQLFYYVLFVPSSYVFALAGTFFDFTFHYSIQDGSYRTPFVVEGWGLVRDFCNMFFIFILLYIAFGTILNLHSVKTKEMIINVVIIGLLINFSLFATQVIIDTSNILARVFYNSDTIKITQGIKAANGVTNATPTLKIGPNGEIPLSAAIVNKVNPQNLIINGRKAVVIQDKVTGETGDATQTEGSLGTGAFILITLLAVAVNVVGIITFLSVGLIFVTRVIGLWMAMIFAPFAFFSYTVPALQDMEMVGWKKWWPETLKLAFLAPVFIFFMYLIIAFLEKGLSLVKSNESTDGMTFVISIIIPFIFIMLLLIKAKDIAKDMSGKLGQSITNGIAAVGGMALGGAALGGAILGRKIIGGGLAAASRTESSQHLANQKIEHNEKLEKWEADNKKGIAVGPKPVFVAPKHGDLIKDKEGNVKKDKNGEDITYNNRNPFTHLGAMLNVAQSKTQETDFARHTTDEATDKAGFKGKSLNELSGAQQARVKKVFVRDNKSKWGQEEEDKFRAGGNSAGKVMTDKDKLKPDQVKELRAKVDSRAASEFEKEMKNAAKGVSAFTRVLSKANTGSYDVRKLSSVTSDKRASVFSKIPVALISAVAMGVRGGLKSAGTSSGGIKVEGNFMKDLGNTISDSLKGMKVNVNLEHVGETKSSADTHGGGAHH